VDLSRYAIGGVLPRHAARPATREEAAEALRAAVRDGLGVVPWGGGVALPFESAPERYGLALDLGALDSIAEYEPADLTLTAECGVTIAALRAALAPHGQELPLEAAFPARATLGGVLAANASGPRRRRFGAPRDRILGARYLLGDGSSARTGGKVVKNVAGYGLHRLLCGSRGGLGVILEASLKLQPAPAARVVLVYGADAALLADRYLWEPFARLEPAALSVVSASLLPDAAGAGAPCAVVIALEDDAPWLAEQERAILHRLGAPARRIEGADAGALLGRLADLEETAGARLSFTTADTTPAATAALLGAAPSIEVARAGGPAGIEVARAGGIGSAGAVPFLFHAPAGRLHLWPGDMPAARLLSDMAEAGWSLIDARGTDPLAPPLPPPVAMLGMRDTLRKALDPAGRFALGPSWSGELRAGTT
jgi:glycolate oxidase FAD binding subunit